MTRNTLAAAIILTLPAALFGQQASKLETFAFDGVPLLSSVHDFKLRQPAAQHVPQKSEPANDMQYYCVLNTHSSAGVAFTFLDDKLFQIEVLYNYDHVMKMGGADKLFEKTKAAFGQGFDVQRSDKGIRVSWKAPGRNADLIVGDTVASMSVKDTKLEALLNERRSKTVSLGF